MIGKTLSHFRIEAKLGAGGMGEVYRAHDERLDRDVALKVLPAAALADDTTRKRFRKEALALSKLNHPNIATVHDFDTQDGIDFLVMEYVEGTTLSERVAKGALPEKEIARLGGQVADALEEAHEQGIIHRDLKPAKVMVTAKGRAKVLDFGIAKLLRPEGETTVGDTATETRGIAGTLPYMAPEQLQGEAVDARTDLYALGMVLYEMATGERPFQAEIAPKLTDAILHQAPLTPRALNARISPELERIILKCLEKEPENRYQSAREVEVGLRRSQTSTSASALKVAAPARMTRRRAVLAAGIGLAGVAGLAVILIYVARAPEEGVPRLINPVQLTSAVGVENYATWSPDGGRLAYESNQSGNWDIWVKQLGGGDPVNLTGDNTGPDRYPSWSPDGRQIAFLSQRDLGWSLLTMASVGGNPRKVVSLSIDPASYRGAPQWSSDGAEMAVAVWDSPRNFAEIVSLETQEKRRIALPQHEGNPCLDLSWSPNGRIFAYVTAEDAAEVTQLWTVPFSGGEPTPVTDGRTNDRSPIWSADGRKLFFVSNQGGVMDLWQQRIGEDGKPEGKA